MQDSARQGWAAPLGCLSSGSSRGSQLAAHLSPVQRMTGPMEGALMSSERRTKAEAHSTTSKLASAAGGALGRGWKPQRGHVGRSVEQEAGR